MPGQKQREAVALIYALARKGLSEPGLEREALRRIAGAVERGFMGKKEKCRDGHAPLKGR
ncbi:MAG: hypothetical protein J6U20_10105 [Fibrobacter sp.]|nr:hypothetical protein [Fibrobacter sp.]